MRNAKKRILRFRDQNFLYICLPENHRAASGRPERCAPIKTATHGTRLCNRFGLRNGFRARPAGRRPHGAGDRLRSGALSPLEQGALQRSPRGPFPPTSQGLSRSAASGGARRDRPPCRSGALRPGAVGRYDGQHPLPDRQGGSSPLAARGVRRKPRRDVRAVEGPYGAGRMRGDQRPLCPLRDQLRLPFGQLLLGRMFLVEGAAPAAPGRSAAARRLVGRRTVRLDSRRADGVPRRRERQDGPLRLRFETDVGRGVGRLSARKVLRRARSRAAARAASSAERQLRLRRRGRHPDRGVGLRTGASGGYSRRRGVHRFAFGSSRRRHPLRDGGAQPRHLGLLHGRHAARSDGR